MSQPFIAKIKELMAQRTPAELVTGAISRMEDWAMLSSGKEVPLEQVAWLAAILLAANPNTDIMRKVRVGSDGSRTVELTAGSTLKSNDGAG